MELCLCCVSGSADTRSAREECSKSADWLWGTATYSTGQCTIAKTVHGEIPDKQAWCHVNFQAARGAAIKAMHAL